MPAIEHFLSLFEAVSRRDWDSLRAIGMNVVEEEKRKKHFNSAHRLLDAIEVATANESFTMVAETSTAPIFQSPLPDLLHRDVSSSISEPILNSQLKHRLEEFLQEWKSEISLREIGLNPRQTLLLHGPPGSGKTHLATYISRSLKLPLFVVRFDSLISSLLGETGGNIRKIFEFAGANRCVLFIDEIDAIGKLRDDKNELGELKRIVISLLQNLDLSTNCSLLIAATNHPHMLDPAIWRRFEAIWEVDTPNTVARKLLLQKYIGREVPEAISRILQKLGEGLTGADLEAIGISSLRRMHLAPSTEIEEAILISLIDHIRRQNGISQDNSNEQKLTMLALELRSVYGKKYSFSDLEGISGIPHSTLHSRFGASARSS